MDTSLAKGWPELPELSKSFTSPPNKIGPSDVVEALGSFR